MLQSVRKSVQRDQQECHQRIASHYLTFERLVGHYHVERSAWNRKDPRAQWSYSVALEELAAQEEIVGTPLAVVVDPSFAEVAGLVVAVVVEPPGVFREDMTEVLAALAALAALAVKSCLVAPDKADQLAVETERIVVVAYRLEAAEDEIVAVFGLEGIRLALEAD
jgi:hypothetical protein